MLSNRYPLIAKETWPILALLLSLTVLVQFVFGLLAFMLALLFFLFLVVLFRDPLRVIPSQPLAVVSPVHGIVTLVEESEDVRLKIKSNRIQITMRPFDIYSLRSPIEGKVMEQWYSAPDKHESRRHLDFHIQSDEGDDVVTAIRLRDIVPYFHVYLCSGERIGQGQRCGYVYFGGVIDIFLPIESKLQVEIGDYVCSGSTVLGQIIHSKAASVIHD